MPRASARGIFMDYPKFNVRIVEKTATRLLLGQSDGVDGLLHKWVGRDIGADTQLQLELLEDVRCRLLQPAVPKALLSSLMPLFNGRISTHVFEELMWRIAARQDDLMLGEVIPPWVGLAEPVYAPVQVVRLRTGWSSGREPVLGSYLTLRAIAGDVCPRLVQRFVTKKFTFVLAKELGIRGSRKKPGFIGEANQLYGMRFVARLVQSRQESSELNFDRFLVGQFESWNKKLLARRAEPCPSGFKFPCHKCSLGEAECPASKVALRACRPVSLQSRICTICSETMWHDGGDCLACRRRRPGAVYESAEGSVQAQ